MAICHEAHLHREEREYVATVTPTLGAFPHGRLREEAQKFLDLPHVTRILYYYYRACQARSGRSVSMRSCSMRALDDAREALPTRDAAQFDTLKETLLRLSATRR